MSLSKSIGVSEYNRPIKIAYIVPYEENEENHLILDAVFFDSYKRWGGTKTLIIPANDNAFQHTIYEEWFKYYDPDFVYSYVELDELLIKKIDFLCHPIAFLHHQCRSLENTWQKYLPNLPVEPVSCFTSIHGINKSKIVPIQTKPLVITQYTDLSTERFIADNFGVREQSFRPVYPLSGLFETLCLDINSDLKEENHDLFTHKTTSILEVLLQIPNNETCTLYQLATLFTEDLPYIRSSEWIESLNIFIGESCVDRINFWNARHLSYGEPGSIIIRKNLLEDEKFIEQLGIYFDKTNCLGGNKGPRVVQLRSMTLTEKELNDFQVKISNYTHNFVKVAKHYSLIAAPELKELKSYTIKKAKSFYRIGESENIILAREPEHFSLVPVHFYHLNKGQWAVELKIERENNLSKFMNVIDTWLLPRRLSASKCFTDNDIHKPI